MDKINQIDSELLEQIADMHGIPQGSFNIRKNGQSIARNSDSDIEIISKTDKSGIDIIVKPGVKNKSVHIPVIITVGNLSDLVYNDFYIGEGADVFIVAGCGIHNSGSKKSEHDGIHCFHIGKNARVKYVEKHYGEGDGTGERILNPRTEVYMDENSYCEMEMVQIKGVDSTKRETLAQLKSGAKIVIFERLMTHGAQTADSDIVIELNGEDSSAQIVSRSVAKNTSRQKFFPKAVGNTRCHAHIQCDSIIMDGAHISSIPAIEANDSEANIIHEAAIGRINSDQLLKLQTLGKTKEEAEEIIINCFLK